MAVTYRDGLQYKELKLVLANASMIPCRYTSFNKFSNKTRVFSTAVVFFTDTIKNKYTLRSNEGLSL